MKWVRLSADTDVAVVVLRDGLFECLGHKVQQIGTGWVIDGSRVAAQTHVAPTQIAVFWGQPIALTDLILWMLIVRKLQGRGKFCHLCRGA